MDGLIAYALAKKYTDKVGQDIISAGFKVQVEDNRNILNRQGEEKVLYLLPKEYGSDQDGYDEFVYANNTWEWVGKTDVDLSDYALKEDIGDLDNLPTTDKSSIVSAISETFTSVSNGKAVVASAITDKGVQTSSDATFSEMAQNIENIPSPTPVVSNPALILWDWEGTKLAEYSAEDALALTELPAPSTFPAYATADHDLLVFQEWNWSLANIKTWIQNHEDKTLDIGAIYTTTDGQDHNYWNHPRLEGTPTAISMQKRATTSIGYKVFYECYSLASVNIPSNVTSIGSYAFCECYSLTSINIPSSVTSIGGYAFSYCYLLTSVNIPSSVTSIGSEAFSYCYSLTSINIPSSVTSIGYKVFSYCYSLASVNIPSNVTSIGNSAFSYCYSLTSINIPSSVTSIGYKVFYECYSLASVNIPSSVTSIGNSAFCECSTLIDIIIRGTPSLSNTDTFSGTASKLKFYVPRANLSWFETATNWSTYYALNKVVAIEDYIEYLESIGYNVDDYKEAA